MAWQKSAQDGFVPDCTNCSGCTGSFSNMGMPCIAHVKWIYLDEEVDYRLYRRTQEFLPRGHICLREGERYPV